MEGRHMDFDGRGDTGRPPASPGRPGGAAPRPAPARAAPRTARPGLPVLCLLGLLALATSPAAAVRVAGVSPQGEVAEVRQVVVRFDAPAAALGARDAAAPYTLVCNGRTPPGDARWNDERTWVYALREPLPAGQRCTLQPQPGFTPVAGAWQDATPRRFSTGAPTPLSVQPYPGGTVDEDGHFLLQLNGRIDPATLAQGAWCEAEGLGERIPVRVVEAATLDRVLRAERQRREAAPWLLLACQRPLPADAAMRLVWGPGIAAADDPTLRTRTARTFAYRVRPRLTAEFTCERENAASACLPLRPLTLRFSAPVPRAQALGARLLPLDAPPGTPTRLPVADDPGASEDETLQSVRFAAPLPPRSRWQLVLPPTVRDDADRPLANADAFPLTVAVGDLPPLAQVAGGAFGVLERPLRGGEPALLPFTVRHVQADLAGARTEGDIAVKHLGPATPDAELLAWLHRVQHWHERRLPAQEAGLPADQWFETETFTDARGRERQRQVPRWVATRELSLLAGERGVQRRALPEAPDARRSGAPPAPTEVLGLPLPAPGLHVVELRSRLLGQALLARDAPMYVRSAALVTNLAVHFKHGRDGSLAWVTTLDRSQPAAGAQVAVNDCRGQPLWTGRSDAQGLVRIPRHFGPEHTVGREGAACLGDDGLFVTARHGPDLAFVRSGWQRGIEPWRFNLPMRWDAHQGGDPLRVHTVFDRVLLRAGETVSMKHLARLERAGPGPRLQRPPAATLPAGLVLTHRGSGTEHRLPVAWTATANAESRWPVPRHAALGTYDVTLEDTDGRRWAGGSFRVEALRVPLVDARLTVAAGPDGVLVAPARVAVQAQLSALAGGGLPQQPVRLSTLLRPRTLQFAGWDGWRFDPPRQPGAGSAAADERMDEDLDGSDPAAARDRLLQTLQAVTDALGGAAFTLEALPPLTAPAELLAELRFTDLNGEVQSVLQRVPLAPSALVLGLRVPDWARAAGRSRLQVAVLDHAGRPQPGRVVQVQGRHHRVLSTRQRIVGGFYAYANTRQVQDLGVLCRGRSDARGLLDCDVELATPGEVELVARADDDAGRAAESATTVWVSAAGDAGGWWFAQGDDDRIDLLPEQREVQPGQTARLQVRMPFREATALVTVEREGVIDARVVTLRGRDPVIEVPVPARRASKRGTAQGHSEGEGGWAPNIVVSVLVLRGREQAVPWWSALTWGWRSPRDWWQAWRAGEGPPPTALADLARPAFRIGAAALRVGLAEHRLDVQVQPERSAYGVRETAHVTVRVTQHGRPVPHAELAFAAVDEGLLALAPNASWDVLDGLLPARPWGVHTATAQGEVIGRRHFGRKALAAGGGGGANPTRELFDTLLLWQGRVTLDARGQARIAVPLNDSLTQFRLVAVAEAGDDRFGTGSASLRVTQDLQLLPGLPALAREGDRFDAQVTLRNTTARPMAVQATLAGQHAGGTLALAPQRATLAPGAAVQLQWAVQVPEGVDEIAWQSEVTETEGATPLRDRVRWVQPVAPAVPVQVLQATLQRLPEARAAPLTLPLAPPAAALAGASAVRGSVALQLSPRLATTPPGLVQWWRAMDWTCLEQQASRAIALQDRAAFDALAAELPALLDADGLPLFYPPRPGDAPRGSDRLAAHLLLAAHANGWRWPGPVEQALLQGLADFVAGRLERRDLPAPRPDLDVRRLAALHALAVHGRAGPRALDAVAFTPAAWPTAALLDALGLLHHAPAVAQRDARRAEVQRVLRSRVQVAGRQLGFSTEAQDAWWWLMDGPDANAARWLLALLDGQADAAGLPEPAALLTGLLARQRRGAWDTTTANLWGALALQRFAQRFEAEPVGGLSVLALAAGDRPAPPATALQPPPGAFTLDWAAAPEGGGAERPWPGAPGAASVLWAQHQGPGRPWLAVQASAAVPLQAPVVAGYRIEQRVEPVQQRQPGRFSRGDVVRVHLTLHAEADMAWVAVHSPIPAGATLLGSGLARDAVVGLDAPVAGHTRLAWEERGADAWRGSFEWLPRGRHTLQYTLRLNHAGDFAVPPVRVQAMYAPEVHGELPQPRWAVRP